MKSTRLLFCLLALGLGACDGTSQRDTPPVEVDDYFCRVDLTPVTLSYQLEGDVLVVYQGEQALRFERVGERDDLFDEWSRRSEIDAHASARTLLSLQDNALSMTNECFLDGELAVVVMAESRAVITDTTIEVLDTRREEKTF